MLKTSNQVIVFLMELVMLYSFAQYGFSKGPGSFKGYSYAALLVVSGIIFWAVFAAPKSARRLSMPYLVILSNTIFSGRRFIVP